MKFAAALSALIGQEHNRRIGYHIPTAGSEKPDTRDEVAAGDKNVRLAVDVFGEQGLLNEFYGEEDKLSFGTFYNCREYGVTVEVGGWTFAVYEHRNSDDIVIEGCPTAEVQEYGPYGGGDKYDVLFSTRWKTEHLAADAMWIAARHVLRHPAATRADLTKVMAAVKKKAS